MRETLLNFAIDFVQPVIRGTTIVETDEELEKNPGQIHLRTKFAVGEMTIRIDQVSPDEQVMRIWGGNHDASPNVVIHINGDDSWRSKLEKAANTLKSDPYLCIPDYED